MPHPSPIPLFKLPGLFKLPAPLTILASLPFSLLRPKSGILLASATCVKATGNVPDTFSIRRDRKHTTVGECRGKKTGCKFGALQKAFREPAFLRQGGDALINLVAMMSKELEVNTGQLAEDLSPVNPIWLKRRHSLESCCRWGDFA